MAEMGNGKSEPHFSDFKSNILKVLQFVKSLMFLNMKNISESSKLAIDVQHCLL